MFAKAAMSERVLVHVWCKVRRYELVYIGKPMCGLAVARNSWS